MPIDFLAASFAIPAIAAAALAVAIAIPLIVHLLFRQRERVVRWAAMRFLPVAMSRRNRRIDHWPLFIARTLALLLPLLAMFAVLPAAERLWQSIRPGALEVTGHGPRTHTIILLDATLSMKAAHDGASAFDLARQKAEDAIRTASPGDGFSLLALDGGAAVRVPGPSNNHDAVLQEIRSVVPFDGPADLAASLLAAGDILARSPAGYARRRVLIVTDLQRTAWNGLLPTSERPAPEIWAKLAARADVAVIDAGREGLENLALADLALADPLPLVDDPILVTATVRNPSRKDRRNVRVEFSLARPGGSLALLAQRTIDAIPADGQASVSLAIEGTSRLRTAGAHVISAKLLEADALPTDDSRALSLDVRDGVNVLLVNGRPSGTPLKRASEFFSEALAPGGRSSTGNPFRVRTVSFEEFSDATLSDLAAVDCVVLCDVPAVTPSQIARMESLLKRGGGVILGLGPNALANRDLYNRLLGPAGCGFIPGRLADLRTAKGAFHLTANDAAFRLPPLSVFQDANARAGLSGVPFNRYVNLELATDSPARRILSFAETGATADDKPEPALVEVARHRGRVVVFTSTFNRDWTDWPILPSFLPFAHELVRFATGNADPWTLSVGEAIEDFLPATAVGQVATLTKPDGTRESATVGPAEAGGVARYRAATVAGLYDVQAAGAAPHAIAVNISTTAAGLGESDLRRLDAAELSSIGVQIASTVSDVKSAIDSDQPQVLTPKPQGPAVARVAIVLALIVLAGELILAWRSGPSRGAITGDTVAPARTFGDRLLRAAGWLVLLVTATALAVAGPALLTGQLPTFVPESVRTTLETLLGVPSANPGEGTRWHFAVQSTFANNLRTDRFIVLGIVAGLMLAAVLLYRRERRAVGSSRAMILPLSLRLAAYALFGLVLLPQLRIVFEREGVPEIAVLVDTSASMATVDPESPTGSRLERVQKLIETDELLQRLFEERRARIVVYSLADRAVLAATIDEARDLGAALEATRALKPVGETSRLGDGVDAVLKAHNGGTLAAVIVASDGVTTHGADLAAAGRSAARAGVPLFTLAVGERREPLDLAIADLKMDDVVAKGDELIVEARLLSRGKISGPVNVTLYEKKGDEKVALDSARITPDSGGKPTPIKLRHRPTENGEKTFIIETPGLLGEADVANNRVERTVLVTEGKKLRVLLIEGRPRYEFRFLKTLLEREVETAGERSFDFHFLLLEAGKDFATTDRGALRAFPSRAELFEYDVVLLGDVEPAMLPQSALVDLADFVRVRGGGLLAIAGEQAMPAKLFDTPLADVLPLLRAGESTLSGEDRPLVDGYRLKLTPLGRQHPLLRLASDDTENASLWQRLAPLLWTSTGYAKRQTAEVLATHPLLAAEESATESHPIILQQFAGGGRVMFFGFDETWRWRLRKDEELFNRFWRQAVRVLARNRVASVELRTAKPGPFRRDEPIVLAVRFPDDAAAPTGPVKVKVERMTASDREVSTLAFAKVEGKRATFEATLTSTPVGAYRFKLVEPAARASTLEFSVLPPPGEMDRLEVNVLDLTRAASESGGKYYLIDNCETLVDDLPEGTRPPLDQPCPPVTLWNLPAVFVTLLSLLACEWILRKRLRLL